jgi:hypothetical protein
VDLAFTIRLGTCIVPAWKKKSRGKTIFGPNEEREGMIKA